MQPLDSGAPEGAGRRFTHGPARSAILNRIALRPQGETSPLLAQTRSAGVVPFVRFAPGARREIVDSLPGLLGLSYSPPFASVTPLHERGMSLIVTASALRPTMVPTISGPYPSF